MANIMIIDDDKVMCDTLFDLVREIGHDATYALSINDGLEAIFSKPFDVVLLDVWMPDGNGLDIIPQIRERPSSPEVIIITGEGDPSGVELAIKNGAWDYIEKPFSVKDITLQIAHVLQYRKGNGTKGQLGILKCNSIIGNSLKIEKSLVSLAQASSCDVNVLITGETGTGKELFARAIHDNSERSQGNFVVVDCAALPETLVESILFGFEKAAFTGADKAKEGLIEQADGGTLFLDEVGELPLTLQKSFLRVLQERRFRSLGGKEEIESDFRLLAATNQDIEEMVQRGQFRKDLLFRLRHLNIEIPPLRERIGDIKELVLYHTTKMYETYGIEAKEFSPAFLKALKKYRWPGNVRELFSTLEIAFTEARYEPVLFPKHLPSYIRIEIAQNTIFNGSEDSVSLEDDTYSSWTLSNFRKYREEMDKKYLQELISFTEHDIKKACLLSGLSRSRLYTLLKERKISYL